jgi:competence protein ComEA
VILGGIAGFNAYIGLFIILFLEGNVMKRYLLMMALLVAVSVTGPCPGFVVAAESPAANTVLEIVNLNQATAEELQVLPGVGPALSERIVLYRAEHGPFKSVTQLTEVKGVGQTKLAKFKDQLTID